ncbi:hypothetical protein KC345_g168 [Hortaea werneckii]|nr:hypothetical protein KC345_g168 [Hortaea werneckii]
MGLQTESGLALSFDHHAPSTTLSSLSFHVRVTASIYWRLLVRVTIVHLLASSCPRIEQSWEVPDPLVWELASRLRQRSDYQMITSISPKIPPHEQFFYCVRMSRCHAVLSLLCVEIYRILEYSLSAGDLAFQASNILGMPFAGVFSASTFKLSRGHQR